MALPALTLLGREPAERLRRALLVALLLAGVLVFATIDRADPDLWGHVRYGQDVLASGHLPATATYTYTAASQPWINHENLSEIAFAFVADHAGGTGLAVLKTLLALGLLALMMASALRQGAGIATTSVAVLLVTFATAPGWSFRPQVFTYAFFAVQVLVRDLVPPRPEIFEWRALSASDTVFPLFVAISALTGTAWLGTRQWRDRARTALLIATAWQSVTHVRHLPFFAIAAGFWLPAHLEPLLDRVRAILGQRQGTRAAGSGWAATAVWVADLGLVVLVALHPRAPLVDRSVYPVNAVRCMAKYRLTGKVVMHFDWAQYAIAAFGDDAPVAFDGRLRTCYPQDVADAYFDFLVGDHLIPRWRAGDSPPFDAARMLHLGDPDLVVVARHFTHSVEVMEAHPEWALL